MFFQNFIKAKRYFVGEPVWKPYNRPSDEMDCRKQYLAHLQDGFKTKNIVQVIQLTKISLILRIITTNITITSL